MNKKIRQVDSLQVFVVVDNVSDIVSTTPPEVKNQIFSTGAVDNELSGEALCCANFGLSLAIRAIKGNESSWLLFDAGPDGDTFEANAKKMALPFDSFRNIVLSHGHWDHAGGLLRSIDLISQASSTEVVCHVNPGMFKSRGFRLGDKRIVKFKNIPNPESLEQSGAVLVNKQEEHLLGQEMFYLSGEIERVTDFEKGFVNHVCKRGGEWVSEPDIMDERYLAVLVNGLGLVVFTACSHAGVVNTLKDAQKKFPEENIYAVMGGFHLSGKGPERVIDETIDELVKFGLKKIIPGHCTGWRAVSGLAQSFDEKTLIPSAVGHKIVFDAKSK